MEKSKEEDRTNNTHSELAPETGGRRNKKCLLIPLNHPASLSKLEWQYTKNSTTGNSFMKKEQIIQWHFHMFASIIPYFSTMYIKSKRFAGFSKLYMHVIKHVFTTGSLELSLDLRK